MDTVIVQETRETNTHRMEFQVRKCIRRQQRNSEVKTQARSSQRGIRTTDVLSFHVSLFCCLFLSNFFSFMHSFLIFKETIRTEFVLISLVVDSCRIHLSFRCLYFTHSIPFHFSLISRSCIRFPLISSFLSIDF